MEESNKDHALLMQARRGYRIEKIKQYGLVVGGVLVAAGASVLLAKEVRKANTEEI